MNTKPALLVAALVAAAVVTAGCEQRGGDQTAGKMDQSPGKMQAQNTPGGGMQPGGGAPGGAQPGGAPGTSSSDKMAQTSPSSGATPPADKSASNQADQASQKVGSAADDAAITAKVKAAILAEPGLRSLAINVDTKDSTVTLSGNVASDQLRDRAKQIAMSTDGVKNVVDNLTVKAG